MDCQAEANQSSLGNKTQQYIKPNQPQLMQWVKANAAAVGVVDRVGQQVVNIHRHGSDQNKVGDLPPGAKSFFSEPLLAVLLVAEQ